MDHKKSPNRTKRQAKILEDYWDCSVCTYRNTAEAFKCLMCDIRKGTSTRKPRINPQLVAQQAAPQFNPGPFKAFKKDEDDEKPRKKRSSDRKSSKKSWRPPRLKNVDRTTGQSREITVNDVTVVITEYKPKKKKPSDVSSTSEVSNSEVSEDDGSADLATDSRSS